MSNDTPTRPTFVLVWPDGTVQIYSPDSNQTGGLATYLQYHNLGSDEPLANVYAVDTEAERTDESPLGMPLRQVKVIGTDRRIDQDDWIEVTYTVSWMDDHASTPLTTLNIRSDGRA